MNYFRRLADFIVTVIVAFLAAEFIGWVFETDPPLQMALLGIILGRVIDLEHK